MKLKSILLSAIVIAMSFGATAQVADLQEYANGTVVTKTYSPQFIGCDGERVVMVEELGRRKNRIELVAYSMDQVELGRVMLTDDKELSCYGGFVNGSNIDLLMAEWHGDDMKLYRERRNLQSLQPVGEQLVLADYKGTSKDKLGFRLSSSPNQELLALMYYVDRESQMTEVQVALYSRELEEYWKADTRSRKISFFSVTDSGDVLIGGRNDATIEMTVMDGENENSYSIDYGKIITNVAEMSLARYENNKFYFIATHHNDMGNKWDNGTLVDYVQSLCYDTKNKDLTEDKYIFTQQDYNRLNNLKDDAKLHKGDNRVRFCSLNQVMSDNKGYYAMLDQTWTVRVDGQLNSKYRQGQMVVRVDNDGKIEWVKTFRINCSATRDIFPTVGYSWVKTDKGPMLAWVERNSKNEPLQEKPVEEFKPMSHPGMLTTLRIDAEGNMVRQHYPMASKTGLQGRPSKMETGDWIVILRGKTKGHFGKLTVR